MKKNLPIIILCFIVAFFMQSCNVTCTSPTIKNYAEITTNFGTFTVGLYEQTPNHRDNFIQKCTANSYNNTILYESKKKNYYAFGLLPGVVEKKYLASNYENSHTIPPELCDKILPKKGTVVMQHFDEKYNTQHFSDEKLFLIIQGEDSVSDYWLNLNTAKRNKDTYKKYIEKFLSQPENKILKDSLKSLQTVRTSQEYNRLYVEIMQKVKPQIEKDGVELYSMTKKEKSIYKTKGGMPFYAGNYTIFGEIVRGIEILDTFAKIKTDRNCLPEKQVEILSTRILTKKEFRKKNNK